MKRNYSLGQVLMFGFSLFFVVSSAVLAMQIDTNMEHAVQTVKRLIITDDGTAEGNVLIELNPGGDAEVLKIKGNMIVGEVDGPMTNKAEGQYSSVGGGQSNWATGWFSYIGGGQQNKSYGKYSTIGGGNLNQANGNQSVIPGGRKNKANGVASLAAGYRAEALHEGSFVRSDMSSIFSTFQSSAENQFLIRSAGGVGINTNDTRFGSLNISAVGPLEGLALYAGSDILARLFFLANNNFYIARAFSDTAGMVIDQEGNIGIGNMEPSSDLKLDVEGKIGATEYCDSDGNNCIAASNLGGGDESTAGELATLLAGRIYQKEAYSDDEELIVLCNDSNDKILGGGCKVTAGTSALQHSKPTTSGTPGWICNRSLQGGGVYTYAICLNVP